MLSVLHRPIIFHYRSFHWTSSHGAFQRWISTKLSACWLRLRDDANVTWPVYPNLRLSRTVEWIIVWKCSLSSEKNIRDHRRHALVEQKPPASSHRNLEWNVHDFKMKYYGIFVVCAISESLLSMLLLIVGLIFKHCSQNVFRKFILDKMFTGMEHVPFIYGDQPGNGHSLDAYWKPWNGR